MNNCKERLSSILKATQMGQIGIRSVMQYAENPDFCSALTSQLREYDTIEREAHNIAKQHGWKLSELNPAIRLMTDASSRMQLFGGNIQSKIAGMMIQGNTRGKIMSIKSRNQTAVKDPQIQMLSQKLLDHEDANIRQMLDFL